MSLETVFVKEEIVSEYEEQITAEHNANEECLRVKKETQWECDENDVSPVHVKIERECNVAMEHDRRKEEECRIENQRHVKKERVWEPEIAAAKSGHEVKRELVLSPEGPQLQDISYTLRNSKTSALHNLEEETVKQKPNGALGCHRPEDGPHSSQNCEEKLLVPLSSTIMLKNVRSARRTNLEMQSDDKQTLTCDHCQKQFSKKPSLIRHIQIHRGERQYLCDICKKRYSSVFNLNRHKRIHTGEKPHTCEFCDKRFTDPCNLMRHKERLHIKEKLFTCKICNKQFNQNGHLTAHKRTHTGEKPYSCGICKKQFSNPSNLKRHNRVHTGEKPFACDVCSKRFADMRNMKRHVRGHTGETLFTCDICCRKFTDSCYLSRHKLTHMVDMHACDICPEQFTNLNNLLKHRKEIHGG